MTRSIVIADASSIMALDNIGELQVLPRLFSQVTITPEVAGEYGKLLPDWTIIRSASPRSLQRPEISDIDPGEAASIALALDYENSLIIIDEKKGRRVAEQLNIEIIGTVGVLIKARIAGFIQNPESILTRLEAVDFRLDDFLRSKLKDPEDKIH